MKNYLTIAFLLVAAQLVAQSHSEKIVRDFTFEKRSADNALMIANINGNISVQGYDGDKILVEVTKTINAKTAARLEKGKTDIQLGVIDLADSLILYVSGECGNFTKQSSRNGNHNHRYWGYSWNNGCQDCHQEY